MATKFPLTSPIPFGDGEVSEIDFRDPLLEHLLELDKVTGKIAQVAKLISVLGDIPPSSVKKIAARDLVGIGKLLEAAMGEFPLDGATE